MFLATSLWQLITDTDIKYFCHVAIALTSCISVASVKWRPSPFYLFRLLWAAVATGQAEKTQTSFCTAVPGGPAKHFQVSRCPRSSLLLSALGSPPSQLHPQRRQRESAGSHTCHLIYWLTVYCCSSPMLNRGGLITSQSELGLKKHTTLLMEFHVINSVREICFVWTLGS